MFVMAVVQMMAVVPVVLVMAVVQMMAVVPMMAMVSVMLVMAVPAPAHVHFDSGFDFCLNGQIQLVDGVSKVDGCSLALAPRLYHRLLAALYHRLLAARRQEQRLCDHAPCWLFRQPSC